MGNLKRMPTFLETGGTAEQWWLRRGPARPQDVAPCPRSLCCLAVAQTDIRCTDLEPAISSPHAGRQWWGSEKRLSLLAFLTWSACLCSRSTCPSAGGGCSAWWPPRCRTSAWPPAWSARGPCRADTWPSGRSWAAGGWSPVCRCPHRRCWRSASSALWASPRTRPEWSRAPACLRLHEQFTLKEDREGHRFLCTHIHTFSLGKWSEHQNRGKKNSPQKAAGFSALIKE